jgi:hypothetical protein
MSLSTDEIVGNGTAEIESRLFVRSRSVVSRVVAGETLIVPVRGKVGDLASIYSFNGTGTLIWQLLDAPRTFAELVDGVMREYEVERTQAENDVAQFLKDLASVDLVEARVAAVEIQTEAASAQALVAQF